MRVFIFLAALVNASLLMALPVTGDGAAALPSSSAAAAASDGSGGTSSSVQKGVNTESTCAKKLFLVLNSFLQVLPDRDLNQITEEIKQRGFLRSIDLARLHAHFALRVRDLVVHPEKRLSVYFAINDVAIAFQALYLEIDVDDFQLLREREENSFFENQTILRLRDLMRETRRSRPALMQPQPGIISTLPQIVAPIATRPPRSLAGAPPRTYGTLSLSSVSDL